ncbi:hypothetical protein KU43P_28910 [Pseudomonas sp. KU43P]|nr:hypothetical protein KU43P_28910 [Pseudomonas sp. KU43P]
MVAMKIAAIAVPIRGGGIGQSDQLPCHGGGTDYQQRLEQRQPTAEQGAQHRERAAGDQRAQAHRPGPTEGMHHLEHHKKGAAPGDGQEQVGGEVARAQGAGSVR